jgi:hypothetical protein
MRKSKNKSLSMAKADKAFSEYIRVRDADTTGMVVCITCEKRNHWQESDAGHFVPRDRKITRYDERNVNGQCQYCNRYRSGEQYKYGLAIDLKYGPGTAQELVDMSTQTIKAGQDFYEQVAGKYKELTVSLRELKGL